MKTTDKRKREILESLRGGLVVSCQVQPEDPIYTKDMAVKMAEAAKWAGAVGIRANTPEQIRQIHRGILDFVRQFLEAERQLGFQLPIRGRDAYAPMRSVCSPKNKRFIRELEGLLDEIQIGVPR